MKKIKTWFKELPKEYRKKAIFNSTSEVLNSREPNSYRALSNAFIWSTSPEGLKYWCKISDEYTTPKFIPSISLNIFNNGN